MADTETSGPGLGPKVIIPAFCLVLVQAVALYFMLGAGGGFDDANITMNYAENLANGHGYVYYVGGERVEGSTSPLWTAINTLGYLLPLDIRVYLAAIGVLVATATVVIVVSDSHRLARAAGQNGTHAAAVAFVVMAALTHITAWMVWSYMDIGLWCLLLVAGLSAIPRMKNSGAWRLIFALILVALVWQRPEGVAFAGVLGLAGAVYGQTRIGGPAIVRSGIYAILVGVAFITVTAIRLWYFGVPFPNTFYAKVSTNSGEQFLHGLHYTAAFIATPSNAVILAFFAAFPIVIGPSVSVRRDWINRAALILFGFLVYSVLGGDHFDFFRFYLFVVPVALPLAATVVASAVPRYEPATRKGRVFLTALAIIAVVASGTAGFWRKSPALAQEIIIARDGRAMGDLLNTLPQIKSIGVLTAGGISLTFDGEIRDLLGLNWVEMAHTGRGKDVVLKNHGGFEASVFWKYPPDAVVFGSPLNCNPSEAVLRYSGRFLDGLFEGERFRAEYALACVEGRAYYERRPSS